MRLAVLAASAAVAFHGMFGLTAELWRLAALQGASVFVVGPTAQLAARRSAGRAPTVARSAVAVLDVAEDVAVDVALQRQSFRDIAAELGANPPSPILPSGSAVATAQDLFQCYASYSNNDGDHVVEDWVLPGYADFSNYFSAWRQQALGGVADVRCEFAAMQEEDVTCVECLLPPHMLSSGEVFGAGMEPVPLTGAGTSGSLEQCQAVSLGAGFCKKGSMHFPAGFLR